MPDAPLMLSVSGLRGLIGKSLTPDVAARYAAAVGSWFRDIATADQSGRAPHIILGRDSRPSGQMIELAATAGLIAAGCRVTRLGIASTPAVGIMVQHLRAQGGMVITASHNPIMWNGIKTVSSDGVAPSAEQAKQIIQRFEQQRIDYAAVEQLQPADDNDAAAATHIEKVIPLINVQAIRRAKLKVVLDSVHGAGGPETRQMLDQLGVECIHLYGEPTGLFPHPPEPTKEHLTELCRQVQTHNAHLGFAQDPDADRLALVDEQGRYIGEEYTLALCALHLMKQGDVVAANLSTSRMIDDIAAKVNGQVVRTPVGEANVAAAMREHHAALGGEGNGGIIIPTVSLIRDSLLGVAIILDMLAQQKQPLSRIVNTIPAYAIVKDKVNVDQQLLAQLEQVMRKNFADARIDTQDGVRLDWPDRWVHVRASNTEPIIRLIAEAADEPQARQIIAQVKTALHLPTK